MQKSEQVTNLYVPGDSEGDEEETTQDEVSSHTSEEDGGVVKVEKELENTEQPVGGNEVAEHEASDNSSRIQDPQPFYLALMCLIHSNDLASGSLVGLHVKSFFLHSSIYLNPTHSSHHTSFPILPRITNPGAASPLLSRQNIHFYKTISRLLKYTLQI